MSRRAPKPHRCGVSSSLTQTNINEREELKTAMECSNCKTTHASIYRGTPDGRTLCDGCASAEENKRRVEANKPSPAQEAIWAEEQRRLDEFHEQERRRPKDPLFCSADGHHERPCAGFSLRGERQCAECLGDLAPAKLSERIAALEAALAAQPQPAARPARAVKS